MPPTELVPTPATESVEHSWMAATRRGDFEAAWQATDRQEAMRRAEERAGTFVWDERYLIWKGEPFAGREVVVRCNHGLGDTLQFIRYVPWLLRGAQSVEVRAQPALVNLLQASGDLGTVRDGWNDDPVPPGALEVEVMELPYAFRSTVETLPQKVPYLTPTRVAEFIGERRPARLCVGLLWAASDWDTTRSVPVELLGALANIPGVQWYSLQQGRQREEWRRAGFEITPWAQRTEAIEDAAAAMQALDLIITMDGMAAHLAGALGRPVWVMLKHDADWRWMAERADSPWYPTMRLFRQATPREWAPVVAAVGAALRAWPVAGA